MLLFVFVFWLHLFEVCFSLKIYLPKNGVCFCINIFFVLFYFFVVFLDYICFKQD